MYWGLRSNPAWYCQAGSWHCIMIPQHSEETVNFFFPWKFRLPQDFLPTEILKCQLFLFLIPISQSGRVFLPPIQILTISPTSPSLFIWSFQYISSASLSLQLHWSWCHSLIHCSLKSKSFNHKKSSIHYLFWYIYIIKKLKWTQKGGNLSSLVRFTARTGPWLKLLCNLWW